MTEADRPDDTLDALLRAGAPEPLPDDGFVARTMIAVDQAARALPARRPAPVAPIVLARALVAERRRQARRARLWHWAIAGAVAGYLMMLVAMIVSPAGGTIAVPPSNWAPLALVMAAGALWVAWGELRSN